MNRPDLDKRLVELKQQYSKLFIDLHRTEGAVQVLEYILAQPDEAPTPPAESDVKE